MSDTNPFPIGRREEGFNLYLPPYDFNEETAMATVMKACEANRQVASRRITGSFIYAHPADYCGRPMLQASVQEWRNLFDELREKHIDTVLFQASLWRELNECYYRSERYSALAQYPVVERMLEAAADKQIKVFLGGYGSVAGWAAQLTREQLQAEIAEHRNCFREVSKLGKFAGCYFPCETAYHGSRNEEAEQRMHYLYKSFSETVKEFDPAMQVIASPAGQPYPGKEQEFQDFWSAILKDRTVDILMPQDTVGNCLCTLSDLLEMWRLWHLVAQKNQVTLWGHIELFERRSYMEKTNLYPASPERVAVQIAIASTVVEKMVAWEVPYFASAASGDEGKILSDFLLTQRSLH